jgi:hypothetical protein
MYIHTHSRGHLYTCRRSKLVLYSVWAQTHEGTCLQAKKTSTQCCVVLLTSRAFCGGNGGQGFKDTAILEPSTLWCGDTKKTSNLSLLTTPEVLYRNPHPTLIAQNLKLPISIVHNNTGQPWRKHSSYPRETCRVRCVQRHFKCEAGQRCIWGNSHSGTTRIYKRTDYCGKNNQHAHVHKQHQRRMKTDLKSGLNDGQGG